MTGEAGGTGRVAEGPESALTRALERMAHQIKNPLQAVMANVEVVRARVAKEAPETWASLERFARAVETNVELLDRRLGLLLALGRRGGGPPSEVDVAGLARDFAAALRSDEGAPGVRVEGTSGLAGRARTGWLLALLLELWEAAAEAGAEETPMTVRGEGGEIVAAMQMPRVALAGEGGEPVLRPAWRELAERAGGRLSVAEEDGATLLVLVLPSG